MSTSQLLDPRWPCAALLLAAATAFAQADDPKQLAATVKAELEARNPDGALDALNRLEKIRGAQAPDYEFLFLKGVTWQEG